MDFVTTSHEVVAMFAWFCYREQTAIMIKSEYWYCHSSWKRSDEPAVELTSGEYALLIEERKLRLEQLVRVVFITAEKVFPNAN
jgi:hypothetical protein